MGRGQSAARDEMRESAFVQRLSLPDCLPSARPGGSCAVLFPSSHYILLLRATPQATVGPQRRDLSGAVLLVFLNLLLLAGLSLLPLPFSVSQIPSSNQQCCTSLPPSFSPSSPSFLPPVMRSPHPPSSRVQRRPRRGSLTTAMARRTLLCL